MHKVFKLEVKGDTLTCAYLYADGHVVCTFDRRTDIGTLHYVKIAQSIGIQCGFEGRIVFHHPAMLMAIASLPSAQINFDLPSIANGSDKTKELGLSIANLNIYSTAGWFSIAWPESVLSSGVSLQPKAAESFDAKRAMWSESRVVVTYCETAA